MIKTERKNGGAGQQELTALDESFFRSPEGTPAGIGDLSGLSAAPVANGLRLRGRRGLGRRESVSNREGQTVAIAVTHVEAPPHPVERPQWEQVGKAALSDPRVSYVETDRGVDAAYRNSLEGPGPVVSAEHAPTFAISFFEAQIFSRALQAARRDFSSPAVSQNLALRGIALSVAGDQEVPMTEGAVLVPGISTILAQGTEISGSDIFTRVLPFRVNDGPYFDSNYSYAAIHSYEKVRQLREAAGAGSPVFPGLLVYNMDRLAVTDSGNEYTVQLPADRAGRESAILRLYVLDFVQPPVKE